MSLVIISFCDIDVCFLLASVCVPGKQVLTINRRAEWSIVGIGTIDSAGRQFIVRNSGNCSIGCRKIFEIGISIPIS